MFDRILMYILIYNSFPVVNCCHSEICLLYWFTMNCGKIFITVLLIAGFFFVSSFFLFWFTDCCGFHSTSFATWSRNIAGPAHIFALVGGKHDLGILPVQPTSKLWRQMHEKTMASITCCTE